MFSVRRRSAERSAETVDVTAFLSLMVILVPFLLVTAVFSRLTIIELDSAIGPETTDPARRGLELEITVRDSAIEVNYAGLPGKIAIDTASEVDAMRQLGELALELKAENPTDGNATVLVEPEIPYYFLVKILDTLRLHPQGAAEVQAAKTLFPDISLGAAPAAGPRTTGAL